MPLRIGVEAYVIGATMKLKDIQEWIYQARHQSDSELQLILYFFIITIRSIIFGSGMMVLISSISNIPLIISIVPCLIVGLYMSIYLAINKM